SIHDFLKGVLHMPGLLQLMLRPGIVKPQYRYTVSVHGMRVYFAEIVVLWNAFAPSGHTNRSSVKSPDVFLQSSAVPPVNSGITKFVLYILPEVFHSGPEPIRGHPQSPSIFDMISPGKIKLFVVQPPW